MKKDNRGFYREYGTVNGRPLDVRAKSKAELKEKVELKKAELKHGNRPVVA